MAVVLSILGGIAGFLAALVALVFFDAAFLTALGLWTATGGVVLVTGFSFAMLSPAPQPVQPGRELA